MSNFIRTRNVISSPSKVDQERATLVRIKKSIYAGDHPEVYTLVCNYLGHIPHYKSHEDICYTILELYMHDLKDSGDRTLKFIDHLLNDMEEAL